MKAWWAFWAGVAATNATYCFAEGRPVLAMVNVAFGIVGVICAVTVKS